MGKKALQWHPAFQAALQVELAGDRPFLCFHEEYNLSRKPLQMDTLIIKLEPGHVVSKSIGRIFRTYNIVEYKSPEDYISVNDFYKVLGYVCIYQADTGKVLEIPPEELTITLVGDHYPRRLVRHLKRRYGVRIRNVTKGIYYIEDFIFPVQLLVTEQLSKEEYTWLGRLRKGLDLTLDIEPLAREYKGKKNDSLYQAVMDVIVRANQKQYEEGRRMCEALKELFADELAEREEKGIEKGIEKGLEKGMEKGVQKGIQALVETCRELHLSRGQCLEKLVEKFQLTEDSAGIYLNTYWK